MRPNGRIVVELFDLIDLIFGLDVAMLCDAEIDADPVLLDSFPIQTGVFDCLIGTVDRDRTGSRAATSFLSLLVAKFVESAHPGKNRRHVASFKRNDPRFPFNERTSIRREIVSVWSSNTHTGDDYSIRITQVVRHSLSI